MRMLNWVRVTQFAVTCLLWLTAWLVSTLYVLHAGRRTRFFSQARGAHTCLYLDLECYFTDTVNCSSQIPSNSWHLYMAENIFGAAGYCELHRIMQTLYFVTVLLEWGSAVLSGLQNVFSMHMFMSSCSCWLEGVMCVIYRPWYRLCCWQQCERTAWARQSVSKCIKTCTRMWLPPSCHILSINLFNGDGYFLSFWHCDFV